jgi:hypothetical protein
MGRAPLFCFGTDSLRCLSSQRYPVTIFAETAARKKNKKAHDCKTFEKAGKKRRFPTELPKNMKSN